VPPTSGKVPLDSFCIESDRWAVCEGEAAETQPEKNHRGNRLSRSAETSALLSH
jgi:hypothetical protein